MNKRTIYFDEALHKYTDEYGNVFTSVTTVISKYVKEFESDKVAKICERIGKNPSHPKYLKYKGKSAKQLLAEWKETTNIALDKGNRKHNYLEYAIKHSNGYKKVEDQFIKDRIFTIPDIIENPIVGQTSIERLWELELDVKYPVIFNIICEFIKDGWKLYSEIGVYSIEHLISGLIDLLLVKDDMFFIIDWKTNKAPINFTSGYYDKDTNGELTDNFIEDGKTLLFPLNYMPASTGHKYSLQLSGYTNLVESFGLKSKGILLCHIQGEEGNEVVNLLNIKYLKSDINLLFNHHTSKNQIKFQSKMFV